MGKLIYVLYLLVVAVLNLLIFLTPYLASTNHWAAPILYRGFSYICHQIPERSFFAFGHQLPVCARDTAIYFTMLVGAVIYPIFSKIESKKIPKLIFFVLAIAPLGIDGVSQLLGIWESTNLVRVVTGGIAGFAIPFYFFPIVNRFVSRR